MNMYLYLIGGMLYAILVVMVYSRWGMTREGIYMAPFALVAWPILFTIDIIGILWNRKAV